MREHCSDGRSEKIWKSSSCKSQKKEKKIKQSSGNPGCGKTLRTLEFLHDFFILQILLYKSAPEGLLATRLTKLKLHPLPGCCIKTRREHDYEGFVGKLFVRLSYFVCFRVFIS